MKILHADHHALFRQGIRYILSQWDTELECLEAGDLPTALQILSVHDDIDLVLVDLYQAGMHGSTGLDAMATANPTLPVVILSACENPDAIKAAMAAGAAGYIPKSAAGETLLKALRLILDGGIYAPRMAFGQGVRDNLDSRETSPVNLTKRQSEVLELMAKGLPNKLIARRLFVSEATVKGHVTAILDALGVDNRVQAVIKAGTGGDLRIAI